MRGYSIKLEEIEEFIEWWDEKIIKQVSECLIYLIQKVETTPDIENLAKNRFQNNLPSAKLCSIFCYELSKVYENSILLCSLDFWFYNQEVYIIPHFLLSNEIMVPDFVSDLSYYPFNKTELDEKEWNKRNSLLTEALKGKKLRYRTLDVGLDSDLGYNDIFKKISSVYSLGPPDPLYESYKILTDFENKNLKEV